MSTALSLTPRQARTALDIFTGLVVLSVAVALAGLTWRLAGHAGTGAITVPSGRSGPAVAPDIAPAIALAPFGKVAAADASQATSLPLELKGVIAASPASLSTAFISVSGAAATPFHVGEAVSGATIQSILRDRVILTAGGRSEYLAFPDPTLSPEQRQAAQNQAAQTPQPGSPVTGSGAGAPPPPAIPPSASTAGLLQRFDATPVNGGFRIGDNGPPGMVAGDVIQSVNGTSLSDPAAANAAFASAQANGNAQIQILRDGKRLTLTVPLR
ncbi:type II secretion system protein N [Sphingomonas sp. DG1-23]|uniref:type II secretion system protein N n=1 Tax=Sphingomonas sp. DG1-23 TaxID=3068316 RepID=UPI00273FDFF8|nr:type II secretion system protein N [Sphingomonas sp. DG1-23]MDP5281235.1 type II secretion system protein N [Sphingomonas sp. DG1-23]